MSMLVTVLAMIMVWGFLGLCIVAVFRCATGWHRRKT